MLMRIWPLIVQHVTRELCRQSAERNMTFSSGSWANTLGLLSPPRSAWLSPHWLLRSLKIGFSPVLP